MKKMALVLALCVFLLCGCGANTQQNNMGGNNTEVNNVNNVSEETSIVGLWKHSEYPDLYSILVNSLEGRNMNLTIEAVKGDYSQIATAEISNAYFKNNRTNFYFEDSFGNSGQCELVVSGNEMKVSYKTNAPYKGGWCIDEGEGTYVKADSAPVSNNVSQEAGGNNQSSDQLPATAFFDEFKKFVKVIGYSHKGDIYDEDIYYEFGVGEGEFEYCNYTKNSYSTDTFGKYSVYTSDKPAYNFKLVLDFADQHQQVFYVKTVIDRTVFDFYLDNDVPYGRFEEYADYAVCRENPGKNTYSFRYDCEYKKFIEDFDPKALEGPFKDLD